MRKLLLTFVLFSLSFAIGTLTAVAADKPNASSSNPFAGHWTYRSFRNNSDPVGDVQANPQKLVNLLFAEAEWVIEDTNDGSFKGQLVFGPDGVMDLTGSIISASGSSPAHVHINGKGRQGTATEKLFYDYDGVLAYSWPNGVNQTPAIVGAVIRVKPHDGAPAGYVASFIAVKKQ